MEVLILNSKMNNCTFIKVDNGEGSNTWKCSVCKRVFYFDEGSPIANLYFYCPHCGAKITEQTFPDEIISDIHKVLGEEVITFGKEIANANLLYVAGSTGFIEGNSGSRVFLRLADYGSTQWKIKVCDYEEGNITFKSPKEITFELVGGAEYQTIIEALEFALVILKGDDNHD